MINLNGVYPKLCKNRDVFITPALGGINENHVMVMPNNHSIRNFQSADVVTKRSLFAAKTYLHDLMDCWYDYAPDKQMVFFEHGATVEHNAGGCRVHGVNAPTTASCSGVAHTHVVELDKSINLDDIEDRILYYGDNFIDKDAALADEYTCDGVGQHAYEGGSYLSFEYVDAGDQHHRIFYAVKNLPSQFLQKIVAEYVNPQQAYMKWQEKAKTEQGFIEFENTLRNIANRRRKIETMPPNPRYSRLVPFVRGIGDYRDQFAD